MLDRLVDPIRLLHLVERARLEPTTTSFARLRNELDYLSLETTLTPEQSGTLYLRINDSAAELSDNAGTLAVEIKPLP